MVIIMGSTEDKKVEYLVVDTTAFIQNAPLQNIGQHILTCQDVVNEITNKRQLRRLVVLPYDLEVKNVDPESIKVVTEFAKKTGDYPSLSAIDIKVMALTYQLEKQHVGIEHLRSEPVMRRQVNIITSKQKPDEANADIVGFYKPQQRKASRTASGGSLEEGNEEEGDSDEGIKSDDNAVEEKSNHMPDNEEESEELDEKLADMLDEKLDLTENVNDDVLNAILEPKKGDSDEEDENEEVEDDEDYNDDEDDDVGWITPSNIQEAKKQIKSELMEEKSVKVACITTDFAMQNVLKQMNLNVAALDGRMIKQLRTFILRCYACFGMTSIMTKLFCPKCGNKTLKRVAVSVDENGKQQIHINARRPLTARGKKFSLPRIKGGKHSNNPHIVEDQPMPDQRPSRLARTKNNPLDDDYIAGYSPFVMRDVTSKSAQLKIRPTTEIKHWMRKNPNEVVRRRK